MKNNKYFLNTLLVAVLFLVMAVFMVLRAVQPPVILPPLNIPNMVLISLIALLLEFWIAPDHDRCYICIPVLAALTFGILPLVAGFACQHTFWKLGLVGGVQNPADLHSFRCAAGVGYPQYDAAFRFGAAAGPLFRRRTEKE